MEGCPHSGQHESQFIDNLKSHNSIGKFPIESGFFSHPAEFVLSDQSSLSY